MAETLPQRSSGDRELETEFVLRTCLRQLDAAAGVPACDLLDPRVPVTETVATLRALQSERRAGVESDDARTFAGKSMRFVASALWTHLRRRTATLLPHAVFDAMVDLARERGAESGANATDSESEADCDDFIDAVANALSDQDLRGIVRALPVPQRSNTALVLGFAAELVRVGHGVDALSAADAITPIIGCSRDAAFMSIRHRRDCLSARLVVRALLERMDSLQQDFASLEEPSSRRQAPLCPPRRLAHTPRLQRASPPSAVSTAAVPAQQRLSWHQQPHPVSVDVRSPPRPRLPAQRDAGARAAAAGRVKRAVSEAAAGVCAASEQSWLDILLRAAAGPVLEQRPEIEFEEREDEEEEREERRPLAMVCKSFSVDRLQSKEDARALASKLDLRIETAFSQASSNKCNSGNNNNMDLPSPEAKRTDSSPEGQKEEQQQRLLEGDTAALLAARRSRLEADKKRLKRRLKLFDEDFERKHARKPERGDKESIRHLYEAYSQLKRRLALLDERNEEPHRVSPVSAASASPSNKSLGGAAPVAASSTSSPSSSSSPARRQRKQRPRVSAERPERGPNADSVEALLREKRALQAKLRAGEKAFEQLHGRKIRTAADVRGREHEYQRYKELKEQLAAMR